MITAILIFLYTGQASLAEHDGNPEYPTFRCIPNFSTEKFDWSGECLNGKFHGTGYLTWYDKGRPRVHYQGDFKNGEPHGKGRGWWREGIEYEGNWRDGKITGIGRFKYKSGGFTIGEFKDGKLHGVGVEKYSDGTIFYGNWKNGRRDGPGLRQYSDGFRRYGTWTNDKALDDVYATEPGVFSFKGKMSKKSGIHGRWFYRGGAEFVGPFDKDLYVCRLRDSDWQICWWNNKDAEWLTRGG